MLSPTNTNANACEDNQAEWRRVLESGNGNGIGIGIGIGVGSVVGVGFGFG